MMEFTPETREIAYSVHVWTRFAAITARLSGVLLFAATVIGTLMFASKSPEQRLTIVAIGTACGVASLTFIAMGSILMRYSERLALATKTRSGSALLEAVPYETGYWLLAAVVMVTYLVVVLVFAVKGPAIAPPAEAAAIPDVASPMFDIASFVFVAIGATVAGLASRPPR